MPPASTYPQAPPLRRPRQDSSSSEPTPASSSNKRIRFTDPPLPMYPAASATSGLASKFPDTADASRPSGFQPYLGAKRLVIKNLRAADPDRDAKIKEHYTRTRRELKDALGAIFWGRKPVTPYERLYRNVEDMCRRGDSEKVYRSLKDRMEHHVVKNILPRVEVAGKGSDMKTAESLLAEWQAWNKQMVLVRSTFSFLDRTYVLNAKLPSINALTITCFRRMAFPTKEVAYAYSVGKKAISALDSLIASDRRGETFETDLLRGGLRMLYILNIYAKRFEPVFLQNSAPFFKEFAESHTTSSLKAYIQACEELLAKEHHRCLNYNIDSATEKQLMDSAHALIIDAYADKLLDGGDLANLLSSKDVESMKGLYDLLKLSGIQRRLREPLAQFIQDAGSQIISDKDRGDEMVIRLLDLRRSLDLMIRDAFGKDEEFSRSMREAFSTMMNNRQTAKCWDIGTSKIGEMIAKHIDTLLRGGLKALPSSLLSDTKDRAAAERDGQSNTADEDAELDRQLDQALELFRFIEGKDTFEAFYKKDLARRLLMGRSASQDAERSMLAKLRTECGASFTHNLEQMFKDQELAKDEMLAYKQWCDASTERRSPIDLQVMILSAAAWPSYPDVQVNLPDVVASQTERFDTFYKNKHTGRVLSWKQALAHCVLKAKFPKGAKELLVSGYQAVVLMAFNSVPDDGFLAYEQISKTTGLKNSDLGRTLQSLACGKVRVLSKHPKGKEVKPTDTFSFNAAFSDPKYRIKINQIQHKETKAENKATHERVAQDRRFETQAAIVRIMKSRKQMTHPELQAEVINMTKKRGSVEPAAIKKEIENLIEKDYIEREGNSYVYLA